LVENPIDQSRLDQGAAYLAALAGLGFQPEGALWSAKFEGAWQPELSIFTRLLIEQGPLELYRALFDAFQSGATPASFDPWQGSLYGPGQLFHELVVEAGMRLQAQPHAFVMSREGSGAVQPLDKVDLGHSDEDLVTRLVRPEWIYRLPTGKEADDTAEAWDRFRRSAMKAA